jgi:hypothetical protein
MLPLTLGPMKETGSKDTFISSNVQRITCAQQIK